MVRLFLFAREQVFFRLPRWLLILSLLGPAPAPGASPQGLVRAPFAAEALSPSGISSRFLRAAPDYAVRAYWAWRGDREAAPLQKPYRARLVALFAAMAVDSLASLAVPFVGQAFYDTAARGAASPQAFAAMVTASALLLLVETLDPLRRVVQLSLTRLGARFTADVRVALLKDAADGTDPGLVYLHAPAMAVRNIDLPVKLPQVLLHGLVSGMLLWRLDPAVALVSVATATGLALWSGRWSAPLAGVTRDLREAENRALQQIRDGTPEAAAAAIRRVAELETEASRRQAWYSGILDRVGTLVLMTGVMLWSAWHQFLWGHPTTGEILAVLALAWHVQFKLTALFELARRRFETDAAAEVLFGPNRRRQNGRSQKPLSSAV